MQLRMKRVQSVPGHGGNGMPIGDGRRPARSQSWLRIPLMIFGTRDSGDGGEDYVTIHFSLTIRMPWGWAMWRRPLPPYSGGG